jgi:short-subunit dehydrogenase
MGKAVDPRDGRVALVTGASTGLGRALTLALAREGYSLALLARRADLLEELAAKVAAAGGKAGVYPCDVAVREQVLEAIRRCRAELGPVDLLIANAGISINTRVEAFDVGAIEKVIRVNLLGAIYPVEGVLPEMLRRGRGHLVAVSSIAGFGGLRLSAAYSASKAGMINFFESLRLDLRGSGVSVTVICPGFVKTPMTAHNRHPMPFLMELDDAVERMMTAIRRPRPFLAFPWPLAAIAWCARILPRPVYDRIAGKVDRRKSPEAGGPADS